MLPGLACVGAPRPEVPGTPLKPPSPNPINLQGEAAEEEADELEEAKALDKFKAMEDRMVLEAALEENFGDRKESDVVVAESLPVWDWLTDFTSEGAEVEGQALEQVREVSLQRNN